MSKIIELSVPHMGDSITSGTIVKINKNIDDSVAIDETVFEIETDKVTLEINSHHNAIVKKILCKVGDVVEIGRTLCELETIVQNEATANKIDDTSSEVTSKKNPDESLSVVNNDISDKKHSMAAKKILAESGLDEKMIKGTGIGGRITKSDAINALANISRENDMQIEHVNDNHVGIMSNKRMNKDIGPAILKIAEKNNIQDIGLELNVPLNEIRRAIAKNLKRSQNNAATITTFNEIDMTNILAIKKNHSSDISERYGLHLGITSFFVFATSLALREYPILNAELTEGNPQQISYKLYHNIGVAIAIDNGLVVPVIKNAEHMNIIEIENAIQNFSRKAKELKLDIDDLNQGTFTITNGGIYGSLLSTPILNTYQSGILGMHHINNRPIAVNNDGVLCTEIRPMMYIALSYDHRIVDGREAVLFLNHIKMLIEDPIRMLLML